MIRAVLVASIISTMTTEAIAESVRVRAGTHQDFTRVVFDFGSAGTWQVTSADGAILVAADPAGIVFDPTGVFRSIGRDRVGAVEVASGSLKLTLACACGFRAFDLPGGRLVIDISEDYGRVPGPEIFAGVTLPTELEPPEIEPRFRVGPAENRRDLDRARLQSTLAVLAMPPVHPARSLPEPAISGTAQSGPIFAGEVGALGLPSLEGGNNGTHLTDSRANLLEQFQRAAAQGLIETAPATTAATPPPGQEEQVPEPPIIVQDRTHLSVETAADRSALATAVAEFARLTSSACLPEAHFDLASWGGVENSPPGLSGLRAVLVGEFDRTDDAKVLDLAKRYLFLGFGAETRSLLSAFDIASDESVILNELAVLIDELPIATPNTVTQSGCDGPAAMWSVLAQGGTSVPSGNTPAVLRSFSSLPPHLRSLLGPRLAAAFLDAGENDTALTLQSMVARAPNSDVEALGLMEARLQLTKGYDIAAGTNLEAVVAADGPQAAIALAELIEARADRGQSIGEDLARAADALAVENRGTETGRRLVKAAIRAFSVAGQPELTFDQIERAIENGSLDSDEATLLQAEAHLNSATHADDIPFLLVSHRYPFSDAPQSGLEIVARRAVAARMLDLGFVEQAAATLISDETKWEAADAMLAARLALARRDPGRALELVGHLADENAGVLRAQALAMQGDTVAAAAAAIAAGQSAMAERIAWRAGDLQTVVSYGGDRLDPAARLVLESNGDPSADDLGIVGSDAAPLRAGREMLARSARIRATFSELIRPDR